MRNAIFMTARVGSSRLSRKHLLKIKDKYCIEYCIDRAKKSKLADGIVLCTTNLEEDDILVEIAKKNGIEYFRGSVEDKLDRWNEACKKFNVNFFVTYDADDLICEPSLIDKAFEQRERNHSNFIQAGENLICGSFTYGISHLALNYVCKKKTSSNTEMMWTFFDNNRIRKEYLEDVPIMFFRNDIRATLDYKEDYEFFKTIIEGMTKGNEDFSLFSLKDIVEFLDKNPEISKINIGCYDLWKNNQMKKIEEQKGGK